MKKRHSLILAAALAVTTGAFAQTRTVDGVGAGVGEFATLSAAVADLAASGDRNNSTPDIINITADITETAHTTFDLSVLTDDIAVTGNGNTIVFQPSAAGSGSVIDVISTNSSYIRISDLTLIPEYDITGGEQAFASNGAAAILIADAAASTSYSVTLDNVVVTASTVGNVAVDPNSAAPADITRFSHTASPIFAGGIRVNATTGGSGNTVNLTDTTVSHTASRGIYTQHKDGTLLTTERCLTSYNLGEGLRSFSMLGNWDVTDCVSTSNGAHNFDTQGTGAVTSMINISGGEFTNSSGGAGYGLNFSAEGTVSIDGVTVTGNGNRGIRFNDPILIVTGLTNSLIADNASHGLDVNELDSASSWANGIDNVIFSGNGTLDVTPNNFSYGDTNTGAVTVEITNSTFHNPGGNQAAVFEAANFNPRFGNDYTFNFTDCIFSGLAGDSDYAVFVTGTSTNRNVNLINCGVVTAGPNALLGMTGGTGTGATVTPTSVINDDPAYYSTTVGDINFLDVNSSAYAGAGSGATNLSGGANYITAVGEWSMY